MSRGTISAMMFPTPIPEIPAAHVDKAATYYVNMLGFTLDWGDEQGGIAGISRGNCSLFITNRGFRESMAMLVRSFSGSMLRARLR